MVSSSDVPATRFRPNLFSAYIINMYLLQEARHVATLQQTNRLGNEIGSVKSLSKELILKKELNIFIVFSHQSEINFY